MACFNNGKQKLNSSDRTYDLKSKVIFNHNSERYENFFDNNFNATICYDPSGTVKKAHSYDLLHSIARGQNMCDESDCSGTQFPTPDTPFGTYTVMTVPVHVSSYLDMSCNYVVDLSCNMQAEYDSTGDTLEGWTAEAHGVYSVLDPSNVLLGDNTDCENKKFLNYVDICGNIV
jgi:hypothetical protein